MKLRCSGPEVFVCGEGLPWVGVGWCGLEWAGVSWRGNAKEGLRHQYSLHLALPTARRCWVVGQSPDVGPVEDLESRVVRRQLVPAYIGVLTEQSVHQSVPAANSCPGSRTFHRPCMSLCPVNMCIMRACCTREQILRAHVGRGKSN